MTVTDADTAIAFRSGEVPVLATPRIVALVEEAAVTAVHPSLDPGCSTVGVRVQIEHISPTPVGGTVTAGPKGCAGITGVCGATPPLPAGDAEAPPDELVDVPEAGARPEVGGFRWEESATSPKHAVLANIATRDATPSHAPRGEVGVTKA